MSKPEMLRRLRLGELKRLLRSRYGPFLPDDDAGREELRELLLPISLGSEAGRKMENAIQIWAPWMCNTPEAGQLIDDIQRSPPYLRKPTSRELGERLGLTYQQRQALGIRTIAPCDMTDDELLERRKARASFLKWKRRRDAGVKTRAEYLASFANSQNRTHPWGAEGIGKRQWFRRKAKMTPGVSVIKLNKVGTDLVSSQRRGQPRKEGQGSKQGRKLARA